MFHKNLKCASTHRIQEYCFLGHNEMYLHTTLKHEWHSEPGKAGVIGLVHSDTAGLQCSRNRVHLVLGRRNYFQRQRKERQKVLQNEKQVTRRKLDKESLRPKEIEMYHKRPMGKNTLLKREINCAWLDYEFGSHS